MLDTNAIVALLQGNAQLIQLLQNADWAGISVISQIEFLVFSGLTQDDRQHFQQFLQQQFQIQNFQRLKPLISRSNQASLRSLHRLK